MTKEKPKILREVSFTLEELSNLIIKEKDMGGLPKRMGFSWIYNEELRVIKFIYSEPFEE